MNLLLNRYLPFLIMLGLSLFLSRNLLAGAQTSIQENIPKSPKKLRYSLMLSSGSSNKSLEVKRERLGEEDIIRQEDKRVYKPNSRNVTGIDFSSEWLSFTFNLVGDFKNNTDNTIRSNQKDLIYRTYWRNWFVNASHYEYYGYYLEDENLDPNEDIYTKYANLRNIGNELTLFYFNNREYIKKGFTYFSPELQTTWSGVFGVKYFNSHTRAAQNMAPSKRNEFEKNEPDLLQVSQEGLAPTAGIAGTFANNGFFIMGMISIGMLGYQQVQTSLDKRPKNKNDFFSSDLIVDLGVMGKRSRGGISLTSSSISYDMTETLEFYQNYSSSKFYYRYFF